MDLSNFGSGAAAPHGWATRWRDWRNRLMASPAFRRWASHTPFVRGIARRRATQLFDLVAGFTYTQTVLAAVETGLLDRLAEGPAAIDRLAGQMRLSDDAAVRLLRACAALRLADEVAPGWWMLGAQGAVLQADTGIQAMVRHHQLLYADIGDPVQLLRDDRTRPTRLSAFWRYAGRDHPGNETRESVEAYSALMASTQAMVSQQIVERYDFGRHRAVLDIGGGHGVFATRLAAAFPHLQIGLFDLPGVIEGMSVGGLCGSAVGHAGDFFRDPIPHGYDCVSLIRILHDHDDAAAGKLLRSIFRSLQPGHRLLIAEPMAATPGAEPMGDAYFGLYLWAMGSGRPRRADEIICLLDEAGFRRSRVLTTAQPLIASLIVATA